MLMTDKFGNNVAVDEKRVFAAHKCGNEDNVLYLYVMSDTGEVDRMCFCVQDDLINGYIEDLESKFS